MWAAISWQREQSPPVETDAFDPTTATDPEPRAVAPTLPPRSGNPSNQSAEQA